MNDLFFTPNALAENASFVWRLLKALILLLITRMNGSRGIACQIEEGIEKFVLI